MFKDKFTIAFRVFNRILFNNLQRMQIRRVIQSNSTLLLKILLQMKSANNDKIKNCRLIIV